jgi:D-beta-D-heptose 7-phosphate kinase/D-beta-D-heptose 1-phosphate adenosyltransferase
MMRKPQRAGDLLAALPGNSSYLEREPGRQTTVKTRYVAHGQQLLRADKETATAVKAGTAEKIAGGL